MPGRFGFHGVPEEVWDFHVGAYQVCYKWLKDRKGRRLSDEDAPTTSESCGPERDDRVMAEIDEVIKAHGGWPGAFHVSGPAKGRRPALLRVAESSPPYGPEGDRERPE